MAGGRRRKSQFGQLKKKRSASYSRFRQDVAAGLQGVTAGCRIQVFWPDDDVFYPGTVIGAIENSQQPHVYNILYDDGAEEEINLLDERF